MPKRSTRFQAIVYLVRRHFADPDVTVTESKMLRNRATGYEREVDVVIEGKLDGEPITISIEVIEHKRPANVEWVERMLKKHEQLPTSRLLLVSESGFTRQAVATVEAESGWAQALTPEIDATGSEATVRRLFVDRITTRPAGCDVRLFRRSEMRSHVVRCEADIDIYRLDGKLLGPLGLLVLDVMHVEDVQRHILTMAREHPNQDELKGFKALFPVQQLLCCLKNVDIDELEIVQALDVWGECTYERAEVPLQQGSLGGRSYRSGEAPFVGRRAVWVETTDIERGSTTISWRWTESPPGADLTLLRHAFHFEEVKELSFSNMEPYLEPPAEEPPA